MCKLFMVANSRMISREDLIKVLSKAAKEITVSDRDGFGWAVSGESGQVFGERYVGNKGIDFPQLVEPVMPEYFRSIFKGGDMECFGEPEEKTVGALLVHARASTNVVCLANSHPHRTSAFTLIHNGVVTNEGKNYKAQSSCDTEHLVHHLSKGGVPAMVKNCAGWYAVGALEHKTGDFYLIKDETSSLVGTFIKQIESLVFATNEYQLKQILDFMEWKYERIFDVLGNKAFIFDTYGILVNERDIEPVKREWKGYTKSFPDMKEDSTVSEKKALSLIPPTTGTEAGGSCNLKSGTKSTGTTDTTRTTTTTDDLSDEISDDMISELMDKEAIRQDRQAREEAWADEFGMQWLNDQMDEMYEIVDIDGAEITYGDFMLLMQADQLRCEITSRRTGYRENVMEFVA